MKTYTNLKDSKFEWLKEIPSHWDVLKLKYVFTNLDSKRIPLSSEERGSMSERIYDYYGASGVIDKVENFIFDEPLILIGEDGANLYSRSTPLAFVAEGKYWVNNHAHILKPKKGNLYYWANLLEMIDYTTYITGSAQPKLTQDALANIELPVAPIEEQECIWNYLRDELINLDGLIQSKINLITLLEEKRQAIITEAVTKGLNPNVKMKDSGVEWIGEIPEHWEIKKIKNVTNVHSSNVDKKSVEGEQEVLLCNYVDVYYKDEITKELDFMKATAKQEQIEKFTLQHDDVIITKDSESPIDIAIPTWVSENLEGVLCGYHLSLLRSNKSLLNGQFLYYSLESEAVREQFYSRANGVTRFGLPKEAIKNGIIPYPPLSEQKEIAQNLYNLNQNIKNIKNEVQEQIKKLKEYRQSLIYEAVTGKMDVRDIEINS